MTTLKQNEKYEENKKKHSYQDLKDTLRSPWFYVTLIIGISLPIILYVLFIFVSLAVE